MNLVSIAKRPRACLLFVGPPDSFFWNGEFSPGTNPCMASTMRILAMRFRDPFILLSIPNKTIIRIILIQKNNFHKLLKLFSINNFYFIGIADLSEFKTRIDLGNISRAYTTFQSMEVIHCKFNISSSQL